MLQYIQIHNIYEQAHKLFPIPKFNFQVKHDKAQIKSYQMVIYTKFYIHKVIYTKLYSEVIYTEDKTGI